MKEHDHDSRVFQEHRKRSVEALGLRVKIPVNPVMTPVLPVVSPVLPVVTPVLTVECQHFRYLTTGLNKTDV